MAPILDPEKGRAADRAAEELAQFEPDPDGLGSSEPAPEPATAEGEDPAQWIVWTDAAGESIWAASELTQFATGWRA